MTPGDSKSKRLWSIIDCRHCADHTETRSRRWLTGADLQRALSMVPFLGPLLAASEGAILTDAYMPNAWASNAKLSAILDRPPAHVAT
jgi:hypothetical protein